MSSITRQIKEFREDRISRILDEGTPQLLDQPLVKRVLAVSAVASSWLTFITLLIATHPEVSGDFRTLAQWRIVFATVMALSFLLLRVAMRRLTSLPEEFLDEREITNRVWAFRTGYLVIRRVALGVAIALVGFLVISRFVEVEPAPGSDVMWFYNLDQSVVGYVTELFSTTGPFVYLAWLAFVMTYNAYVFPLILLAWREANEGIVIQGRRPEVSKLHALSTRYFRKLWRVAIFGLFTFASMFTYSLFSYGYIWVIFAWSAYSLYVYVWASFQLVKTLLSLQNPKLGDEVKSATRSLLTAFTLSAFSGAFIIVVLCFANQLGLNIGAALLCGFASVVFHAYGFALVRRIAYILAADKKDLK
jgi:uncharacterized membrane protein (DUF485 family)